MPTGRNWLYFTYVNLGFIIGIISIYYFSSVNEIKKNWPLYRCNPMYMPFSNDIESDFTYCVQNTQKNMMGYLLQPLTYMLSNISTMSGEFMDSINLVRAMFNKIRNFFTDITQNIFGVFLNIIIEFQKITIGIKDLIGKLIGTMVTIFYIMDGTMKTMQSAWNGPPGQMTQALGNCFEPDTLIKLQNGNIVKMKDLNLGDILCNGSRVNAVMKIDNYTNETIYKIPNSGVNKSDIYVSGTHLVYDIISKKFIQVKNYEKAIKQEDKKIEWFSCIITSDHNIQIGDELFWDWEDHNLKRLM